ncbi:CusA/CzcA family heavy metal efflux RND transporter [Bacteroidota bacterium]
MISSIIDFSLKNRLIIGILTIVLIAWGIYNFRMLPIDAVPDITNNQVQVITIAPSLAPQEVEQFITFPVEIAMANIQDVTEIRSISRFGLSVVTIVFKDAVNPYLARQLVSEQIKMAEGEIPEGYGKPEMMPVTTGLGEIYQYVVEAKPGFESFYNPMELRTIQDWIVKRQLSGIPGIVEISSFGGFIKQYEVTVKPRTLVGMDITITEVFEALERNNENTGGSYIEKGPNAYYIRAEGIIESIDDIKNIVVNNIQGIPVLIGDIAEVQLKAPPRFGAMTKDGKGETVGGITLMLKGANSNQVIQDVKDRIELVKQMLPEGVDIVPYLDRSELISKTIKTVRNNLLEGGLIVIFVLILLLGNYRAGLIVASVIPLSMLFAFSMMNLFNVSANLMSLGAIDFGLIVDGSVIIVEGIVYQIHKGNYKKKLTQKELDQSIFIAGSKVSKSAVFGVMIILIVYIPILAFTGIEGKMFKPMAQTVIFALLGALILSLTYVPVVASLFLSKNVKEKITIADRIVTFLENAHKPVLEFSLRFKKLLLLLVVIVLVVSFYLFSRMGGEFIPTLEEGDLAAQMTLAPGSSLTESVKSSTKAEKILLEQFPEVKAVVSKIGTAEVPTDPMAIEDADIMIVMKPKSEWITADNREDLVDKMKEALNVIPGVSFEFTQPIQLRFNELMTGIKSDVAIKIYGDDLNILYDKGNEVASLVNNIKGAGDVRVEQITGLPQLLIKYKRDQIAQYGLSIEDVNRIIRIAFGGESAGLVYEGERRFDLVMRLCEDCRSNLSSIENLRVNNPSGDLILLKHVADISIQNGPMQISRDDTKRRITIGINVRNRDIESFIDEVAQTLDQKLTLDPGYYLTYGGEFENLQDAKRTSSIAVPISLVVILVLLYFAFYSLKQALMIYSAIPLAAVGGILALLLRGMPFSISAGVGFIALFGVAVLNGIVLLSYYNQLEKEGVNDIYERVRRGTRVRLRPVIMTASVAALGFLPMAISSAPGAEVQKPLATVVIGGLITATFLTLIVLPVIYILFSDVKKIKIKNKGAATILLLFILSSSNIFSQDVKNPITMNDAIKIALENNPEIKIAEYRLEKVRKLEKTAFDLPFPELSMERGQINSNLTDNYFSVSQTINFPTVYTSQRKEQKENQKLTEYDLAITSDQVIIEVINSYLNILYYKERVKILKKQDSLFTIFLSSVNRRYQEGESGIIPKLTSENRQKQIKMELLKVGREFANSIADLQLLLDVNMKIFPVEKEYFRLPKPEINSNISPLLDYYKQQVAVNKASKGTESMRMLPDISIGYFNQSIDRANGFQGMQFGINIPLWFWSSSGKIQAAKLESIVSEHEFLYQQNKINQKLLNFYNQINNYDIILNEYEDVTLINTKQIQDLALSSFQQGEINYLEFIQLISETMNFNMEYLDAMHDYNMIILTLASYKGVFNTLNISIDENN